jgi:hypothetical protein
MIAARIGETVTTEELTKLCPRCERNYFTVRDAFRKQPALSREHLVEYPYPALSRVARIDICSACGQDEAMRDFTGASPIPPYEWPIRTDPVAA